MKHYLHIGLGKLCNLSDFGDGKKFQFGLISPLINDPEWKIWACDCKYYTDSELQAIKESDWVEELIHESICVDWPNVPLIDKWDSVSVMEHVKADEAELFITKLRSKVTNNSEGYVHIDLSDHYNNQFTNTEKLKDSEWAINYFEKNDKKYGMYLNRISAQEWIEYFSKHFEFRIVKNLPECLTLMDVKPK